MSSRERVPGRIRAAHHDRIKDDETTGEVRRKAREATPAMNQHREIKRRYPDAVVFFRMGDFYEMFYEDARVAHKVLGLTLTKRGHDSHGEIPLAGFPHHQLDPYLAKMTTAGYKVAVVDQMEDPRLAKGVVKRDVTQIVTAGTVVLDRVLDEKKSHWLAAIIPHAERCGIALIESASGDFQCYEIAPEQLRSELSTLSPAELLYPRDQRESLQRTFDALSGTVYTALDEWLFEHDFAHDLLCTHFRTVSLKGFGIAELPHAIGAAGAALHYLKLSQLGNAEQITSVHRGHPERCMLMDRATIHHLEIVAPSEPGGKSLFEILDKCRTPMGSRLLRRRLLSPLLSVADITHRQNQVALFYEQSTLAQTTSELLSSIGDLQRSAGRLAASRGNPRDAGTVKNALEYSQPLFDALAHHESFQALRNIDRCAELNLLLSRSLGDRLPMNLTEGGVIREGYHTELDRLRSLSGQGRAAMAAFQKQERDRTGIATLAVAYNRVYGYYIEISKAAAQNAPQEYRRIQTLVNAERFKTPELQKFEDDVLTAEDKAIDIEAELFAEIRTAIAEQHTQLLKLSEAIAEIDVSVALAEVARLNQYHRPVVDDSGDLSIEALRHPTLELSLHTAEAFVPNNIQLSDQVRMWLITGPNMAGKSTFLRSVALNVLMTQCGCFIPARKARIGVVDRLFTRIGANDRLSQGESTFLVEMTEAAYLINNATSRSLVLLDEVGRGTSTFDGLSIAWAMVERLATHPEPAPRTLFATHYHELTILNEQFPTIENWNVQVKETGDSILFLRKIVKGPCDRSYGIHVAKLAGMPPELLLRAEEVLELLQKGALAPESAARIANQRKRLVANFQLSLFAPEDVSLRHELQGVDTDQLTPLQALQQLHEWKQRFGAGDSMPPNQTSNEG